MPPRPYWKGYLKLSLVSCPIALYSATSSAERVAFRQINKRTGNRLKQQLIDEEELEAISIESSHAIDIDNFVPRAQIDERYLDGNYYLVPEGRVGQDA